MGQDHMSGLHESVDAAELIQANQIQLRRAGSVCLSTFGSEHPCRTETVHMSDKEKKVKSK